MRRANRVFVVAHHQRIGRGFFAGNECGIVRVEIGPALAAQQIDPQVARHRKNPGGRRSAHGIEQGRFSPHGQHRFLREIFGDNAARAQANEIAFDARRKWANRNSNARRSRLCAIRTMRSLSLAGGGESVFVMLRGPESRWRMAASPSREGLTLGRGSVCDTYAIITGFTRNHRIRITRSHRGRVATRYCPPAVKVRVSSA